MSIVADPNVILSCSKGISYISQSVGGVHYDVRRSLYSMPREIIINYRINRSYDNILWRLNAIKNRLDRMGQQLADISYMYCEVELLLTRDAGYKNPYQMKLSFLETLIGVLSAKNLFKIAGVVSSTFKPIAKWFDPLAKIYDAKIGINALPSPSKLILSGAKAGVALFEASLKISKSNPFQAYKVTGLTKDFFSALHPSNYARYGKNAYNSAKEILKGRKVGNFIRKIPEKVKGAFEKANSPTPFQAAEVIIDTADSVFDNLDEIRKGGTEGLMGLSRTFIETGFGGLQTLLLPGPLSLGVDIASEEITRKILGKPKNLKNVLSDAAIGAAEFVGNKASDVVWGGIQLAKKSIDAGGKYAKGSIKVVSSFFVKLGF